MWLGFRKLGFQPNDLTVFLKSKAKWAVTRGHSFDAEGSGFARLNIACTRAKLDTAFKQLDAAIASLAAKKLSGA